MTAMIDIERQHLIFRVHRLLTAASNDLIGCSQSLNIAEKVIDLVTDGIAEYNAHEELTTVITDKAEGGNTVAFRYLTKRQLDRLVSMHLDKDDSYTLRQED